METNECKNLLKSFSSFANLHVLNATIDDFNDDLEPSDEIKNVLKWYKERNNSASIVILIRDLDIDQDEIAEEVIKEAIDQIKMKTSEFYTETLIHVNYVSNIKYNEKRVKENGIEKRRITTELSKFTEKVGKKQDVSILAIKRKYQELIGADKQSEVINIEKKYSELFALKLDNVKQIFSLSNLNRTILNTQKKKKTALVIPDNQYKISLLDNEEEELKKKQEAERR